MEELLNRYRAFYNAPKGLAVLCSVKNTGEAFLPLTDYDFSTEAGHIRYWDHCIQNMELALEKRRGINDMWVPGITMHYGFGAFGAIYNDHPLTFTQDTSYMHGLSDSWALSYDKNRFWSQMYLKCVAYISKQSGGRYFVTPYPAPCPMDAVNLIRENNLFMDVYDHPEKLKGLLSAAAQGIVAHLSAIRERDCSGLPGVMCFNRWIPSGCLLLDDAGDLCSPEIYQQFVKPYTQLVINQLGGGYIHHHSLGCQQFQNIAGYQNLYVQQISSDPGVMRPINNLDNLKEQTKNSHAAVDLECTKQEVLEHLSELTSGKFIVLVECTDYEDAGAFLEQIKSLAPIF